MTSGFGVMPEPSTFEAQLSDPDSLSQAPEAMPVTTDSRNKRIMRILKRANIALVLLLFIGMIGLIVRNVSRPAQTAKVANVADQFDPVTLPLQGFIASEEGLKFSASSVVINGSLKLNDGLIVAPSVQPSAPSSGQLYFDQNTRQLAYYNGTAFVPLTAQSQVVQSVGGISGAITLGGGLGVVGNQLTVTDNGVSSVGGQAGAIALGDGLSMAGNTLQNGGVLSVIAGANISVTNDGNGNYTVNNTGAGTGTVTSPGGTAGAVPLFDASQNIVDSLLTQSGGTITVGGNQTVTGSLSLGTALSVGNGGTGATSLTANGVVVANGAAAFTAVTAGGAGLCLMSTGGAPAFSVCPGGGGVTSLNSLTGALTLANASTAGSTITIDDATNSGTKGIASFNSTNFSVAAGAVNTVQNINSGATPTFAGVNTNAVTPSSALTIGAVGQTTLLRGSTTTITSNGPGNNIVLDAANTIELQDNTNVTGGLTASGTITTGTALQQGLLVLHDGNGETATISIGSALAANTALAIPSGVGATDTFCLQTMANCAGAAATLQSAYNNSTNPEIVLDATRGALTVRDNATPLGANLLEVQNNAGGTTYFAVTALGMTVTGAATVTGNINTSAGMIQTAGTTRLDGSGNLSNIGTLSLSGAISGGTTITGSGNFNTTGGGIQTGNTTRIDNSGNLTNIGSLTAGGNATLQGGSVTIGTNAQTGSLILYDGSANTGTVQTAALGQNTVYTLPDPGAGTATICLTTGNCAGTGGGVTGTGTNDRIAKFTSTGSTIGDSSISDNGTTVTINGSTNLVIQGGTGTLGTTSQVGTLVISDGSSNTVSIATAALAGDRVYTLPDAGGSATFCLSTGNCIGGGGGGAPNNAGYLLTTLDGTLTNDRALTAGSNISFNDAGANGNFTVATVMNPSFTTSVTTPTLQSSSALGISSAAGQAVTVNAGTTIELQDDTNITGSLTLTNALTVANGGTGATSFTSNGVVYGNNTGALQVTAAGTSGQVLVANASGVPTFVSISGDITVSDTGVTAIQANSVALGTDTTGNYVSVLGALTGLTTTGNSGEGSTPTLSVTYGSGANTAVQGNVAVTCPSGAGNLTGGGNSITLGTGGSCNAINIVNNPTFSTSVTSPALILTGAGNSGTLEVANLGQSTTYTLPDPGAATATICLSSGNCLGGGGGGANTALSNLASVAINTTLLPGTAGTVNLGSATLPFGDLFLAGSSGTPATNNFRFTGTSTGGTRLLTLPDASGTICLQGSSSCSFAPTTGGTGYIQNQNAGQQTSSNYWISGTGRADTSLLTSLLDTATGVALDIGTTNATVINFNESSVLAAGKSITITGGNTASRPGSPSEGMVYYDTTTKQLLVYANAKWQADRTTATKIVAMGAPAGCTGSTPTASQNYDAADYVVNSCTSAQTTINSAISALPAGGGTVYLMEGTYIVDGSIDLASNVAIKGSGNATVVKLKDSTASTVSMFNTPTSMTNFEIAYLKLDGNKSNQSSGQHTGVLVNGISSGYYKIHDLRIENFRNAGLDLSANNFSVDRVTATGNDWGAANLSGSYGVVTNNNFYTNGASAATLTLGGTNSMATANTVSGGGYWGIYVYGSGNTLTGNTVTGNTKGIALNGATDTTVSGNVVSGNSDSGIETTNTSANNNIISSNRLHDNGGSGSTSGITIRSTGNTINGNTITDTAGTGYAIDIVSTAVNTQLSGNTYSGTGAASINDAGTGTVYNGQVNGSGSLITRANNGAAIGTTSATSSLSVQGSYVGTALPSPGAPGVTNQGTAGSTSYTYAVSATDGFGETLISSTTATATGNATLTGSNFNRITWSRVGGAVSYKVYRTASSGTPSSTGLIGTVAASSVTMQLDDTGLSASGSVPSANTTGGMSLAGALQGTSATFSTSLAVTGTVSGSTSLNLLSGVLTNNSASGTQQVALLQNAAGSGTTEALLTLDNADTDTAVTAGLKVTSAAGTITTGIDVSGSNITTAISVGANPISGTTGNIDFTNFDLNGTSGTLRLSGSGTENFVGNTGNVPTKINVPFMDPGTNGQIIAVGLPSSTASSSSRAIVAFDARSGGHQPTIGVISPDESVIGGFTWEGTNDSFYIKNTAAAGSIVLGSAVGTTVQGALNNTAGAVSFTGATTGDALTVTNSTSTGNIAVFRDNATTVATIANGGGVNFTNETNSATAFVVQNATAADTLFTIDTAARGASGGNRIKIGNSTGTDGNLTMFQLDAATADPTSNLAALNGGLFYNSTTNKVSLIENGQVKIICNTTDLGCGTGTVTQQLAYNNSTGGTTPEIKLDSTRTAFDIQDADTTLGANLFNVRGSNGSGLGTTLFGVASTGAVSVSGSLTAGGEINGGSYSGGGLTDCDAQNSKVLWDTTTKMFSCGTDRASVGIRKPSDESRTSQSTVQNDADFFFSVGANETWAFEIQGVLHTSATGGFKLAFTAPTGSTCVFASNDLYDAQNINSTTCGGAGVTQNATDTIDHPFLIFGTLVTGGTGGTFRFQWAQGTSTGTSTVIEAGSYLVAYKLSGADLAEAYYSKDHSIGPGHLVRVDGSLKAGVQKTSGAYDDGALGIVTTEPGMILGERTAASGQGKPVLLALAGRVPVRVSLENGPIKAGDYLTSSSTPGVAMKATKPGQMVGKALEDFANPNPDSQGTVMTFVNLTWANPNSGVTADNNLQAGAISAADLNVSGTTTTENLVVTGTATVKELLVGSMISTKDITVSGSATFAGDINLAGVGQSRNAITKRFKASGPVAIGAVVIVDPAHDGQVITTTVPGDTRVLGVALTEAHAAGDEITVAIGGSVQVRTMNGAAIQGGDLLVSSSQAGLAEETADPQPGSVLGKALGKPDDDLTWLLITLN